MNETKSKIPKGYKMTKLGVIPEEWVISELSEVSLIKGDYGINAAAVNYDENLPKYLRITDIDSDGNFILEKPKSVDDENSKDFYLEEGDIVFARTGATVGKSYLHHKSNGKLVFAGFLIRFRLNTEIISPYFLKFFIKTSYYNNWIRVFSVRSGQPGINSKELGKLPIPLPPLPEQQKIASILSTWDKAIATQEALITQKEQLKKGLMQALLTGKKRFAGFEEEWEEEKLGNLFKIQGRVGWKGYRKEDLREYGPYVIGAKHIRNQLLDLSNPTYLSREKFEESPEIMIKPNDLLVVQRGSLGKIVLIEDEIGEATINPSMAILRPINADLNLKYIYYFLCSDFIQNLIISETGSTGVPMISQKQMGSFKIIYPTLEEQQKIANTLSSADKEIENLKTQLATMKLQKQGLMQELLTGKRRVKIE